MATVTLEDAIRSAGGAVPLMRNSSARPHAFPVTAEFTTWRSEQRAWRESCALLDQAHQMTDLFVTGPDALRLFSDLGVNSFSTFAPGKAKQFVAVNHDGFIIGDAILFYLGEESFDLVGHPMVHDWVQFNLETGDYRATSERDDNSIVRQDGPPKLFRYELQGPNAGPLMEKVTGRQLPDLKFFNLAAFPIAELEVRALRHGMAGQPGFELFGPWDQCERVREALIEAGEEFDLVLAGAKAYSTANLESGWVPAPLPAIFTGDAMKPHREWLPAPAVGALGGTFYSDDVVT